MFEGKSDGASVKTLEQIETMIEGYLKDHPYDIDMLFKLAFIENTAPLVDYPKALTCLQKILELDPQNVEALVTQTAIYYQNSTIPKSVLTSLLNIRPKDYNHCYISLKPCIMKI